MITDERLREIEHAIAYVRVNPRPVGCRCAGSCQRCIDWREQAAKIPVGTVLELVRELRSARSALTWLEQNVTTARLYRCDDAAEGCNGIALVARALSEAGR